MSGLDLIIGSHRRRASSEIEAVVRSPTNMAATKIVAIVFIEYTYSILLKCISVVDFNKMTSR